jgi:hypothetical protein
LKNAYDRKSKMLLGFGVILLVLIGETLVAHQRLPNPASPYVWAGLGAGAVVCFAAAAWFRHKSRRA